MNPMPVRCPVCSNALSVTRLQCGHCGTAIEGSFGLGRFQSLSPEQLKFAELFIKCRGKIKDVQEVLDISYPTVVARLNDVVRAMGYEVDESDLSEVDRYEYYQAQVLNPQPVAPRPPMPPVPPMSPMPPMPPMTSKKGGPKVSAEKKQET